jgi:hypothetical protein
MLRRTRPETEASAFPAFLQATLGSWRRSGGGVCGHHQEGTGCGCVDEGMSMSTRYQTGIDDREDGLESGRLRRAAESRDLAVRLKIDRGDIYT